MSTAKPKICLNMIVKDEGHVIKETLESVYKYINYYVVNDTGSTDDTKKIIKEFFDSKGIKGEIITHEFRSCKCHGPEWKRYSFFHFGWNRSYALKLCEGKSEYIWVMDADDLVVGDFDLSNLTEDSYLLTYGKGFTYQRAQIFKNNKTYNWKYIGALHEYPTCDKKNIKKAKLPGNYYVDSRRLGARSKDALKYQRDAQVFEELLRENPNDERNAFYCGQSYFDFKDYKNSMKWYKRRIEMKGWYEEVFYSHYKVAQCLEMLQMPWKDVEKAYYDTYNYCKIRGAEPLYRIANHYRLAGDYVTGYKYAKIGSKIKYPEQCVLFLFQDVYDYKIHDELAINAYYLGKYHESFSINKKLLENGVIPKEDLERITNNLKFSADKMREKEKDLCCFYCGNEYISKDHKLVNVIRETMKNYKILLVGNRVDIYGINDIMICTIDQLKSLNTISVQHLVLYNSLNYFYDNVKIDAGHTILIQNDGLIKITLSNGMHIGIFNYEYLNQLFQSITKIICLDKKHKDIIVNDYKLSSDLVYEMDNYIIFDEAKHKYIFKQLIDNEVNGLVYREPEYIKLMKDNKDVYGFAKKMLHGFNEDIIKQYPQMPEHHYKMASLNIELGDYASALNNLNDGIKIINPKLKTHQSYKDVISIAKAKILQKTDKPMESYNLADEVLKRNLIPETLRKGSEDVRDLNIDNIKDTYLSYPSTKIEKIQKKLKTVNEIKVMVTITTCKRFDLFEKTINSFINCCNDFEAIDYWLCVDDNSSPEDRKLMQKKYPFFNYIFKNESQKGHYVSMNIIREETINKNTKYVLHMEDDWHYVQKRNYISESIKILNDDDKIGQVLFNKNYAEIEPYKKRIGGGVHKKTKDGMRYVVHEYYDTESKEYKDFIERNKGVGTCGYWPHFSFRPSMLKIDVYKNVGLFYNTAHFEMQYAIEYIKLGYISAYLDTFSSIHIGKKTWETNGQNSYHLNKTGQFTLSDDTLTINVMSDNKNHQIWKQFKENAKDLLPYYIRHIPKTIKGLNDYQKKIFNENNFNYIRSILSPIAINIELIKSTKSKFMLLLNENVTFGNNFNTLFKNLIEMMKNNKEYDIVFFDKWENGDGDDKDQLKFIANERQFINLESFGCYIISLGGIVKIIKHIMQNGVKDINYLDGLKLNSYILNKPLFVFNGIHENIVHDTFRELDGYKFYSQLDSCGNDLGYYGEKTIDELRNICEENNGKGFNTLGWVKKSVVGENEFIYLPNSSKTSDGFYCKN